MKQLFHEKALPILLAVEAREKIERVMLFEHPSGLACTFNTEASKKIIKETILFIESYIGGNPSSHPGLEWRKVTPFTRSILLKLASLPFGKNCTYKQMAQMVGSPKGARAVGGACGRNPFPFLIPCHRVLSSQNMGGFSAGLHFKKILLDFEKISNLINS